MTIKTLISYENWLLLKRGKIEPMIGDKIITNSAAKCNSNLQISIVNRIELSDKIYSSKYDYWIYYKSTRRPIELIWVEVEVESSNLIL